MQKGPHLCLMIACGLIFGLSVASSQELTPDEGRLILGQLYELRSARAELEVYREHAERERDLERDRTETYRALYDSVTRGRSWQCTLAKVVTLGMARCR